MDSKIVGSLDMANITFDVTSFTLGVDSAIRTETASNFGASYVQGFDSAVDNAIRSRSPSSIWGMSCVHGFVSVVDSAIRSWATSIREASYVHGFASVVNNAISSIASGTNLGTSHSYSTVHDFTSIVNNAMNSIGEDLGTSYSHVHGFALPMDNAMNSNEEELRTSHSPMHGFALPMDYAMSSNEEKFGTSHSPVHGFALPEKNRISSIEDVGTSHSPAHSFALPVENAMSSIEEDLETSHSPVHGFASQVPNAMNGIGEDLETSQSPVQGFAMPLDTGMSDSGEDLGTSHSTVHGFALGVDNEMIRTFAALLSQEEVESSATGRVVVKLFTLSEVKAATHNFSYLNKIFGARVVYRGKFPDGNTVAIKRVETLSKENSAIKFDESDLAFLSRLHDHKNLVGLVGLCKEKNERFFVYEYMKNGSLYDRLHDKNNVTKSSSMLNHWKMRIKIALDISRGIKYLQNYADPYIIHRSICSSNILLDATWTAKVSNFGLSLTNSELNRDVYGLGVVLLELLTGKRPIFVYKKHGSTKSSWKHVVEFGVSAILNGHLDEILDPRVGSPNVNEAKAVELLANTAIKCVNLKGKDKPTMADIVLNLEQALNIYTL